MTTYLFSIGLVPVQEWIAEARRSRDLWAGSVLLWHLTAKVLARIEAEAAGRIVLPRLPDGDLRRRAALDFGEALAEAYGIPNRASGFLELPDAAAVAAFLGSLEGEVVRGDWTAWRDRFLAPQGRHPGETSFWADLEPHLAEYLGKVGPAGDCPFSVAWVAVPAADGEEPEAEALRRVDELFLSVKRTRPIRPWRGGAPVGKCTQCGRREGIGPTSGFDAWRDWHRKRGQERWIARGFRLDATERLCYVCLAKRMSGYSGPDREGFPSTGQVAALPWIAALEEAGLGGHLAALRRHLPAGEDPGSAVFRRSALPAELADEEDRKIAQAVDALLAAAKAYEPSPGTEAEPLAKRPSPYLALLTFDGDSMGKRVREAPEEIPRRLAEFAEAARRVLERAGAAVFYLAGDEGLAMVAAEGALEVGLALRERFGETFADLPPSSDFPEPPTLSMGMTFFDQARPIEKAIDGAHACLERAKVRPGKNALGVTVDTASGTRWTVVLPWGADWRRIATAARWVREGRLAAGWAYDVERFVESIPAEDWRELAGTPELLRAEVRRLLGRRLAKRRGQRLDPAVAWKDLQGEALWGPESREPVPEQFHLIGFLGRTGKGAAAAQGDL